MNNQHPILFCFIGPGASGKSSICTALVDSTDIGKKASWLTVQLSISSTTRTPRPYEIEGKEYYFISKDEFDRKVSSGSFIEHAEFAGNFYGTDQKNIDIARKAGSNLLLDIEINGVRQLRDKYQEHVVVVFVCPPSLKELKSRLLRRGSDSDERIMERLQLAENEVRTALESNFSDYVIVNEDLDRSIQLARAIVLAESVKRKRISANKLVKLLTEE
ncbi:MAG TPA: guanylate kinase [Oligoflexia bacterium]|nr:guanylate kinase [Oligoflexia bacterium]HMP47383.1 guanylate kinase [Oligoflexia bacterium]